MKTLLIYNPVAAGGRSLDVVGRVKKFLESEGVEYAMRSTASSPQDPAPDWHHYSAALLVGGDGTLHRLLNTWGIPPIPVCLISGGSGNDFSRLCHGTARLDQQLDHFKRGRTTRADLGKCNDIWFATGVGIGFDGKVAEVLRKNSRWKGHAAYLMAVIQQIFVYRETFLSIKTDERQLEGKSLMLTVGNGSEFGGGFRVTPQASFYDGIFHCCRIKEVSIPGRIFHLPKVEKGKHENLACTEMFETTTLTVKSEKLLPCHMDGEVYHWKDFDIEMKAASLTLIT